MSGPESVPTCEYLLQVTTSSEEEALEAIGAELGLSFLRRTDRGLGRYMRLEQKDKLVAIAVRTKGMGAVGERGSTVVAWRFQAATGASVVLQIGMAFGVAPTRQRIGDVLVAKSILTYDQRDIISVDGREIVTYPRVIPISTNPAVIQECEAYLRTWYASDPDCTVSVGALLSGGAKITCAAFRDRLWRDLHERSDDPIIGGEMEGVGLVGVGPGPDILWDVIKGISDFADETRGKNKKFDEESNRIACHNAVRFTLGMMLHTSRRSG